MNPNHLQNKMLIFPCGGISEVGRLTLLAAQELILEGKGGWVCLKELKELPQIGKEAVFASRLIVVDGCEIQCGKKYVSQLGRLLEFHLSLADLGIQISEGDEGGGEDLQLVKDAIIAESTRLSKQPALFLVPYSRISVIKDKKAEECIEIINLNIPPRHLSWLIFPFTGVRKLQLQIAELSKLVREID